MLQRIRAHRRLAGLLVVAVFAAWIGAVAFHHHPNSAPCEVCKSLHSAHASLPATAPAPRPGITIRQVAPTALSTPPESPRPHTQSRAPPLT